MAPTDLPSRYAVIGNPVMHSKSPQIHAAFAGQTDQNMVYERLAAPVDAFPHTVDEFFSTGGAGLNVTVPFKMEAFELTRGRQTPRAMAAGAVNTLWVKHGEFHGCNTDGVGLLRDLGRLGVALDRARVLLVGAGGAARGVVLPLLSACAQRLHVVNRTEERAHELVQAFAEHPAAARLSAGGTTSGIMLHSQWDVVINATASSLGDTAPDLPPGLYAPDSLAYDMMYASQPTAFMRQATTDGAARTADGLGMLVEQAAESFFLWRGVRPQTAPVLSSLRAMLQTGA